MKLEELMKVGIPLVIKYKETTTTEVVAKAFNTSKRQSNEWLKQGAIKQRIMGDFMIIKKGKDVACVVKGTNG